MDAGRGIIYMMEQQAKRGGQKKMITFKEYFKLLLDGKPNEFMVEYFNNNDKPYPERYHEFEEYLEELYDSDVKLTDEMEDVLEEIDDVESGYGDVDD